MARRHRPHEEEEHENHERWLISYADMVTLLFALFIVLYAMSIIDLEKYRAFQQSFSSDIGQGVEAVPGEDDDPSGVLRDEEPGPADGSLSDASLARPGEMPESPSEGAVPGPEAVPDLSEQAAQEQLEDLREQVLEALTAAGLAGSVDVTMESRGLVVFVSDAVLFDSGQADLLPEGGDLVRRLADVVAGVGNDVDVEGHTDDRPISTARYPSNWELSTARATAVVRDLVERGQVQPGRVSAIGHADSRPRFPNDGADNRSKNRRVEIVVHSATDSTGGPGGAGQEDAHGDAAPEEKAPEKKAPEKKKADDHGDDDHGDGGGH